MFEMARNIFKNIKKSMGSEEYKENISEFQKALEKLVYEYDTADWENRFIVGGALEVLFCALLNSMGFKCKWLREKRYDIEVNGVKFSMKSSFTGSGDIRLINILGNETVTWEEPTLFFISGVGICYADPEMDIETRQKRDALVVRVEKIKEVIEQSNNEWLISIDIPRKPQNPSKIKTAGYGVAKSILDEINSKYLRNHLPVI
ncbi:MAG: hypothetical protein OCU24_04280 [Candidatus Methanospirare jalkutatii]|nr:hypothetical protein [Candidatus Methanospirare jalkutatii]